MMKKTSRYVCRRMIGSFLFVLLIVSSMPVQGQAASYPKYKATILGTPIKEAYSYDGDNYLYLNDAGDPVVLCDGLDMPDQAYQTIYSRTQSATYTSDGFVVEDYYSSGEIGGIYPYARPWKKGEYYYVVCETDEFDQDDSYAIAKYTDKEILWKQTVKHGHCKPVIYKVNGNRVFYYIPDQYNGSKDSKSATIASLNLKTGKEKVLHRVGFDIYECDGKYAYGCVQNLKKKKLAIKQYSLETGKTRVIRVENFHSEVSKDRWKLCGSFHDGAVMFRTLKGSIFYGDFDSKTFKKVGIYKKPYQLRKYWIDNMVMKNRNEFYISYGYFRSDTYEKYKLVKFNL